MFSSTPQYVHREVAAGRMTVTQGLEVLEQQHDAELRAAFWQRLLSWIAVALIGLVLLGAALVRAEPATTPAAEPATTISINWIILALAVLGVALQFYRRQLEPIVDAKLAAVAADPKQPTAVRTLAHVAADLEPIVTAAVGNMLADVTAGMHAGKSSSEIAAATAADVEAAVHPALKAEVEQYLGPAGGAFADFIEGLIHDKLHAAAAAGVTAAAKITTPATAVDALNKAAAPVTT